MMQLTKDHFQPSSSHTEVPYDLEQLGAYITSYHSVSLDDQYDGVVNLPHHANLYISPIQSWIKVVWASTYYFGKNFDGIIHAYDFSSNPPILDHHACFTFSE